MHQSLKTRSQNSVKYVIGKRNVCWFVSPCESEMKIVRHVNRLPSGNLGKVVPVVWGWRELARCHIQYCNEGGRERKGKLGKNMKAKTSTVVFRIMFLILVNRWVESYVCEEHVLKQTMKQEASYMMKQPSATLFASICSLVLHRCVLQGT